MSIQAIIDNAASISFNRDLTVASTTSLSKQLKYFRRGPIQSVAEVQLNVMEQDTFKPIFGAISKDKLGPYNVQFPDEVVGASLTHTLTVNGADQTGNSVDISSTSNDTLVATAGTLIQFAGDPHVYVVTDDVTTDSSGTATINLDYPLNESPDNNGAIVAGEDVVFSMFLTSVPNFTQNPIGLVYTDGTFVFQEEF